MMFIVHMEALSSKKIDKNELLSAQAKIGIGLDRNVSVRLAALQLKKVKLCK